ncbi:MAG: methanogenesis marker 8 protein [Candidatus Methanoperedens sp.]
MNRHVVEAMGRTRIIIEDGKVVEVGSPLTRYCPIWDKVKGVKKLNPQTAKENIEYRIREFGMFTQDRRIKMDVFVGFGASETFMTALEARLIDSCVINCDGAGTIITSNPVLVQGIGAVMPGLLETSPIMALIKRIEGSGGIVLDPANAIIDSAAGVKKAIELGYKKIGVTVSTVEVAKTCRQLESGHNVEVITFGVHLTGIGKEDARELIRSLDITTGCMSRNIRNSASGKAVAQFGVSIPIFALTKRGKKLLLERAKEIESQILVNTVCLPVLPEDAQPEPLV